MIIAIERNAFNYILKYNSISISITQILDLSQNSIESQISEPNEFIIREFDRILPVFEQDQEILLVEVEKNELEISGKITLPFKAITKIYPLTIKAKNILAGKLNQNIEVGAPKFEKVIEQVKLIRAIKIRDILIDKLYKILLVTGKPTIKFSNDVQLIIRSLLMGNSPSASLLSHLLSYNYNPNEISSGNVEFFEKIGIITYSYKKGRSDGYTDSPFYKACEKNKKEINVGSYSDGYNKYFELLSTKNLDLIWSDSHNKINKIFNDEGYENIDFLKIAYYFIAIKTRLNKNDANLIEILDQIIEDLYYDKNSMIYVLYLIGYTYSFEQLYESVHILERAPLLKNKFITSDVAAIHKQLAELDSKKALNEVASQDNKLQEIHISIDESKKMNEKIGMDSENKNVQEWIINPIVPNANEDKTTVYEQKDKEEGVIPISEQNISNIDSNNLADQIDRKTDTIISSEDTSEQESQITNLEEKKAGHTNYVSISEEDFEHVKDESNKIINEPEVIYEDRNFLHEKTSEQQARIKVSDFKIWVLSAAPNKSKKVNWEKFISVRFPDQDMLITIDELATEINNYPSGDELYTKKDAKNPFTGANILEYFITKGK